MYARALLTASASIPANTVTSLSGCFSFWAAIRAAGRALAILQTSVLPRSEQNIKTVRAVYELGEIKITDLIAEQRRLLDANRDLTEALTERFRAHADLQIAIGVPFLK